MNITLPQNYNHLTSQQRREVREEYIRIQDNKCAHCNLPLDKDPPLVIQCKKINKRLFPPNFFKWPVHLHHNHSTGMTIGAVHALCNAVLWEYHGE